MLPEQCPDQAKPRKLAGSSKPMQVRALLAQAAWVEADFRARMTTLLDAFNQSGTVAEVVTACKRSCPTFDLDFERKLTLSKTHQSPQTRSQITPAIESFVLDLRSQMKLSSASDSLARG